MKIGFESKKGDTGILLLHGLSGTPSEVEPLGTYLSEKGISTLGPWLKGHGTTPRGFGRNPWQDWAASAREAYEALRETCSKVFRGGSVHGGASGPSLGLPFPGGGGHFHGGAHPHL